MGPRGVPQIEVTFDIDANGILNVTAQDKGSGKSSNVTIKNDRGRLNQADIDRMVSDAERYKDEDDKQRARVAARNKFESYCFNVKQAVEEELEHRMQELQKAASPIMAKLHGNSQQGQQQCGKGGAGGPTVEEMD